MRKIVILLLALSMLLSLAACGGRTNAETTEKKEETPEAIGETPSETTDTPAEEDAPAIPSGLYMLKYIGDENGEYVEEANVFEDFFGRPVTLMDMLWADNSTFWCEIGEDGVGTFTAGTYDPVGMDFNTGEPGMLLFGGVRSYDAMSDEYVAEEALVPYHYDEETGEFWFEEEPGFWDVMEPCSQEKLDLVFEGKGGSVPLSEAEVGDLVCMGVYQQTRDAEENEPIYWRVLDKDGDKLFLLSDKLLDSFSYNYNPDQEVLTDLTWETCSLRAFLNDAEVGFLTMFTEEEIARMLETHLENKAANEELMAQWGTFEDQGENACADTHKGVLHSL